MLASIAKQFANEISGALERTNFSEPLNSPQVQTLLQGAINKCNLVSREEFDAQTAVLQRTREKVEALEKQLQALEETINATVKTSNNDNAG